MSVLDPHDRGLRITFFDDAAARSKREENLALAELRDRIVAARAYEKLKLPWFKLALFGAARSANGSLRHNANVISITGCELDYDGGAISFDDAVATLRRARVRGIVYSTPSYTVAAPRWRVLMPASESLVPEWHPTLVERGQRVFDGVFARESATLSQAYFYGAVGSNPAPLAEVIDGAFVDLRDDLGCVIAADQPTSEPQASIEDVATWMSGIPNRDDLDWNDWNGIGMALFAATAGTDQGLALFHEWSAKSAKYKERETSRRWKHYRRSPPSRIGAGTLCYWFNVFFDESDFDVAGNGELNEATLL